MTLKEFKNGIYDALIHGQFDENNRDPLYKKGYDFGLTLYSDLNYEEE